MWVALPKSFGRLGYVLYTSEYQRNLFLEFSLKVISYLKLIYIKKEY